MSSLPRSPRTRKAKQPLAARFLGGADDSGARLLLIRKDGIDYTYLCSPIRDRRYQESELVGFSLSKPCELPHDGYAVDLNERRCECLGFERWGRCKHVEGLLLAIRSAPEAVGHRGTQDAPCPF